MNNMRSLLIIWLTMFMISSIVAQPFPCDGRLIIASNNNGSTTLSYRVTLPFSPPFFSPMAFYPNGSFDALGFNSRDNYIYGVQKNTNAIVKLQRNNIYDTVGIVLLVDTLNSYAGDCTPEGLYLCYENELDQILVFNVLENFELVDRLDLFWDPSSANNGPFKTSIYDFTIDPNNPTVAYSYQGNFEHEEFDPQETRGYILRINLDFNDPNVGMVTPIAPIDSNQIMHLGGLLFSPGSNLFGFGSSIPGLLPKQHKFIAINHFSGDITGSQAISPGATLSDGCSCPYSFTFTNLAPQEGIFCNNDEKLFVLTIANSSFNSLDDIILTDTFPEGMIIEKITGNFKGIIDKGTGVGTKYLVISGLQIPAKNSVEIEVKVRAIDIPVGFTTNQAYLKNLPERFEGDMASDDPWTAGTRGDASTFSVSPQRLDELIWDIAPPSDCLVANDAQVIASSPQFFPGQEYEIKLRNKIGWAESTFNVIIDDDNSFLLDSLIPGNYQLFQVRSMNDNCSLALKDTTIIIDPPNEQLQLEADSNGPVCEGELLQLNGSVFPEGEIRWTGPMLFVSPEINPIIENAIPEQSGEYKLELTFGYCEKDTLVEVIVAPDIKASITGKPEYCEREQMQLKAGGNGEQIKFRWSGPNDLVASDNTIYNPSISPEDEGYYQVIVDNGACQDTTGVDVIILPSPTISLPEFIETDYCDPVILKPIISGDNHVTYSWMPQEGLTCMGCSSPEVIPIVHSEYRLTVVNDHLCKDSADVKIILDKEKLLSVPNVFRPNSAFQNDHFTVFPKCVVQQVNYLEIYNRWGNQVYSTHSVDLIQNSVYWDGYIQGQIGSPGVYIWKAEVELVDGNIQVLTGDITLLH